MDKSDIILLTQHCAAQAKEIGSLLADFDVVELTDDGSQLAAGPRYFCFIDWLLPDMSGLECCRMLRALPATANARIIMLLDTDDIDARRRAIEAGADDYLSGDISTSAIARRVEQYLGHVSDAAIGGNGDHIVIDRQAFVVRHRGRRIALARSEFDLLAHFASSSDRVYSREQLVAFLRKGNADIDPRTVDVWVGRLRRALIAHGAPDPLRTVRSIGYARSDVEIIAWPPGTAILPES
jgi:two-component system phosphate regulon response regulator PhoB